MDTSIAAIDSKIQTLLLTLKSQGHIDGQFEQLLLLQDDSEPDFVRSVMELFFQVCTSPATSGRRQVHECCCLLGAASRKQAHHMRNIGPAA